MAYTNEVIVTLTIDNSKQFMFYHSTFWGTDRVRLKAHCFYILHVYVSIHIGESILRMLL